MKNAADVARQLNVAVVRAAISQLERSERGQGLVRALDRFLTESGYGGADRQNKDAIAVLLDVYDSYPNVVRAEIDLHNERTA